MLITLIKGFTGKPSHAPLTDVSVGAYTVGVAMLVLGAAGVEQDAMARGALLAISGGLLVAVPTSLTGLLDYFDLPKRSVKRKLATYHLLVMVTATGLFAATWLAQRQGYLDGEVTTLGLALGVAAFGLLVLGGTLGGALAYVYGVRVVKRDVPIADALIPGRLDAQSAPRPVRAPAPVATAVAPVVATPAPATVAGQSGTDLAMATARAAQAAADRAAIS